MPLATSPAFFMRCFMRCKTALSLCALLLCAPLSAATPPFQDTIAQRMTACTVCHGKEGRAATDGYYPRIAGKTEGYLYNQLVNFQDGRRNYQLMNHLVSQFSPAYQREIAHYFATLDLPYAAPQPPAAEPAVLQRGRALVFDGDKARGLPACASCHGAALIGMQPAIPGLLGLPRDYINGQLGAWRVGQRRAQAPDCMAHITKILDTSDINAISHWLAAQPVPSHAKPAPASTALLPLTCGDMPGKAGSAP